MVGTLQQDLLEHLLTRLQSKENYKMRVQARTTAFENAEQCYMLRLEAYAT